MVLANGDKIKIGKDRWVIKRIYLNCAHAANSVIFLEDNIGGQMAINYLAFSEVLKTRITDEEFNEKNTSQ